MAALRLTCLVLVLAALAGALAAPGGGSATPRRPNVLLVSIDSLRADHVSSYGHHRETTPAIDRLAREGVLFENAISPASWTVPAHATLLSALPPELHGITAHDRALDAEAVTLAEVLRAEGYRTAAFVSGPTVLAHYGFDQGFERYDESMSETSRARANVGATSPGLVELVGAAIEAWDEGGRAQPFFVFLHMWDVHYDYAPPPPWDRKFDPDYAGDLTSADFERNPRIHADMPRRDLEHLIALYDGEIAFTDEHLGRILQHLAALGVLDDTIVVVTADHGDEFFEHGFKGHAKTLYDEIVRVPLVVRYPPLVAAGQRLERQVRLMDVAPTILGLAGVAPPPGFGAGTVREEHRALDLTPWIAGRRPERPLPELLAFSESSAFLGVKSSVRTNAAKLVRHAGDPDATEVYDLAVDPGETRNLLAGSPPEHLVAELNADLDGWLATWAAREQLAVRRRPSRRHEARLRAIGYVE